MNEYISERMTSVTGTRLECNLAGRFGATTKERCQGLVQLQDRTRVEAAQCCLQVEHRLGSLFPKPHFSECLSQDITFE